MDVFIKDFVFAFSVGIGIVLVVFYVWEKAQNKIKQEIYELALDAARVKIEENFNQFASTASDVAKIQIDKTFNYLLSTTYDETEKTGHWWTYKVEGEDGHWVSVGYNNKTEKFTVVHHRTLANLEVRMPNNSAGEMLATEIAELNHNAEYVYGSKSAVPPSGWEKSRGIFVRPEIK